MRNQVNIARSAAELTSFLAETISKSDFRLDRITISEQSDWAVTNGVLSHFTSGFFQITGLKSKITDEEHLVLYQPQSAITGLILCKKDSEVYVLLQARIEPGNSGVGQYGPTIQSTPANYLQQHGGKRTSYADLFTSFYANVNPLGNCDQLDLGKRYYHKNKVHSYLEVNEFIETEENMIWAPLHVIEEVLSISNYLNADLRSLISVFDWDLYLHGVQSVNESGSCGCLGFSESKLGSMPWELTTLDRLNKWKLEDEGIIDISGTGIWVNMYAISCKSREVAAWSQPLLCCASQGLVVLVMRKKNGTYEFLVTIEDEFGISGSDTVLPSCVIYPGEINNYEASLCENTITVSEMLQSEEGGRFYKNESQYKVVLAEKEILIKPNQRWISVEGLKSILKSSNRASFQLRCISSLVLGKLNPHTFEPQ